MQLIVYSRSVAAVQARFEGTLHYVLHHLMALTLNGFCWSTMCILQVARIDVWLAGAKGADCLVKLFMFVCCKGPFSAVIEECNISEVTEA